MPLMTRINGRPIVLTFTPVPLTQYIEIREVFSGNAYTITEDQHATVGHRMAILMSWPEFGWDVRVHAPIRNLDCRGPRDRRSGPSILTQAWNLL